MILSEIERCINHDIDLQRETRRCMADRNNHNEEENFGSRSIATNVVETVDDTQLCPDHYSIATNVEL